MGNRNGRSYAVSTRRRIVDLVLIAGLALLAAPVARAETMAPLALDLGEGQSCELVWIEPGTFLQGSPTEEKGRESDEDLHRVTLTQGFYIGRFPITVGQYARFVAETHYRTEAETGKSGGFGFNGKDVVQSTEYHWNHPGYPTSDQHPVTIVTFLDAEAFCKWLSRRSSRPITLPTESQWEFACRAGTSTRTYAGDSDAEIDQIAWHKGNATTGAMPVGQKMPNDFGIHDMCGNVNEWCLDRYNTYPVGDAQDPLQLQEIQGQKLRHVLRGGSWLRDRRRSRSASRYQSDPKSRNPDIGFRIVALLAKVEAQPALESPHHAPRSFPPESVLTDPPDPSLRPTLEFEFDSNGNTGPPARTSFGSWFLVACGLGGLFLLVVAAFLLTVLRSVFRTAAQPPSPDSLIDRSAAIPPSQTDSRIDVVQDGFWCDTSGLRLGMNVLYQYRSSDQIHRMSFEVEHPSRQFIFTGCCPAEVQILDTSEPAADDFVEHPEAFRDDGPAQPSTVVLPGGMNMGGTRRDDQDTSRPPVHHPPAY